MLSLDEIEKTIIELESHDTTFATCEKLAYLYIVKDHIKGAKPEAKEAKGIEASGESEFMRMIEGKDCDTVLGVFDELMVTLKIVNPRLYNGVLAKLE